MDKSEKETLKKLKWSINQAKKSKFYGKKLKDFNISKLRDIRKLPFTTKHELRKGYPFDFLAVPVHETIAYHESFGTTGAPVSSWLSVRDFENYCNQILECEINFTKNDVVLIRFPYALSVPAHIVSGAARKKKACVIPASSRSLVTPYTRIIQLLKKLKVTVLGCLSLEAFLLAETARLLGYDPSEDFRELRGICTAGDLVTKSKLKFLERLWSAKIFPLFGTTETGNLAASCRYGSLHCSTKHFFFETIDPETEELTDGRGELVVTTLTRVALPLVRYKTGDIVQLDDGRCPCGKTHVLTHYGRKDESIRYPSKTITLGELEEILFASLSDWLDGLWMVTVRERDLLIKMESEKKQIPQDVLQNIQKTLGITVNVKLVSPGDLLSREKLLRIQPIIKSTYIANWKEHGKFAFTLDELLQGYGTFVQLPCEKISMFYPKVSHHAFHHPSTWYGERFITHTRAKREREHGA